MELAYIEDDAIPDGWMSNSCESIRLGESNGWMRCSEVLDGPFTPFHE